MTTIAKTRSLMSTALEGGGGGAESSSAEGMCLLCLGRSQRLFRGMYRGEAVQLCNAIRAEMGHVFI